MDTERFETLAQAYGGDTRRWPEADRPAAERFRAASPELARRLLDEAGDLDFALGAWRAPAPSMALRDKVLATAPKPRARPVWRGFGLWMSGAGFAAAAAAGVIFGLAASSAAVSDARVDAVLAATLPEEAGLLAPFTVGLTGTRPA